jgi:hypothetical protein
MSTGTGNEVSIIVLNWNGWKDTIECLESVFRLDHVGFRVIVCDNASSDNSMEKIQQWAKGELVAEPANPELSRLISPPVPKPIRFIEVLPNQMQSAAADSTAQLILIHTGANLGFAGGNNVGLRYALCDPNCQFFWMLNNDTVVEPASLSAMVHRMQVQPAIGLCGSLTLFYYRPREVQSEGGLHYSRWTARVSKPRKRTIDELTAEPARMDYVNGVSMLARRTFLDRVGFMEESYFLYFEEMDWAMRTQGKFDLGYARESVIYHKEGGSIGSNIDRKKRSLLSDKYLSRNRALFTKRFLPWAIPSVVTAIMLAAGHRLIHGDVERFKGMIASMIQGLLAKSVPQRNLGEDDGKSDAA